MMRSWSEYDVATGELTGNCVEHNIPGLPMPERPGRAWVDGQFHPDTHAVVDGVPTARRRAQPTPDHVWDEQSERWVLSIESMQRTSVLAAARTAAVDQEQQSLRAMRELLIALGKPGGLDTSSEAYKKLEQIDSSIKDGLGRVGIRENKT